MDETAARSTETLNDLSGNVSSRGVIYRLGFDPVDACPA